MAARKKSIRAYMSEIKGYADRIAKIANGGKDKKPSKLDIDLGDLFGSLKS